MKAKKNEISDAEIQAQFAMQAYAKANRITILAFRRESFSGVLIGVAVEQRTRWDGKPSYSFGRVYQIFAEQCSYYQQGCAHYDNFEEAQKNALEFFGIKQHHYVNAQSH